MIKGLDELLKDLESNIDILSKIDSLPHQPIVNSKRLSSISDQIGERGSLADRLAKTPEDAQTIKRVEDIRLGQHTDESADITKLDEADQKIAERMVDDIIRNILKQ